MQNISTAPKVGQFTATTLVVANMVGTGVFTSLGFQLVEGMSIPAIILLWIVGGLVALCGALCYGELGAAMPRSGGEYHFLSKIYHPAVGFLAGWISLVVGFSAPIAAAAIAMGQYFMSVFEQGEENSTIINLGVKSIAVGIVLLVSLIHQNRLSIVGNFQKIFTILKVSLILVLIIAGFTIEHPQAISFVPQRSVVDDLLSAPFAVSLIFVMYAYSGWNAASYIVGEMKQPSRKLPAALTLGTLLVMVMYVLLNAVFLHAAPVEAMAGKVEVGKIAAQYIFGEEGGIIMAVLIGFGLISAISSMVWAGPRVSMTMGEDYQSLSFFARKNKNQIPVAALWVQFGIVLLMILTSSFESIIYYASFVLSLSTFVAVFGVFVLRFTKKEIKLPFKTPLYPLPPLVFLIVFGWMLYHVATNRPYEVVVSLATILLGILVFMYEQKRLKANNIKIKETVLGDSSKD